MYFLNRNKSAKWGFHDGMAGKESLVAVKRKDYFNIFLIGQQKKGTNNNARINRRAST